MPVFGVAARSGRMPSSGQMKESRPVSRVLSRAIIPLRSTSPWTSSGLPGSARGSALRTLSPESAASLFGLAPGGVCHASLVTKAAVRSYRTVSPLPSPTAACAACSVSVRRESLGGLFSVALSVGSRPPGVTWHLIRRSPDFPPPRSMSEQRLPGRLSWLLWAQSRRPAALREHTPRPFQSRVSRERPWETLNQSLSGAGEALLCWMRA